MSYYTYQLRCADGSIYAGIAADLSRRMKEHCSGDPKSAKYTKSHAPVALCAAWESPDRATASRLEYKLKQLPKEKKERLASGEGLETAFEGDFASGYRPLSEEERDACFPNKK